MANPRAGTRTRKPKPPPVERDPAIRMFEVMALMRAVEDRMARRIGPIWVPPALVSTPNGKLRLPPTARGAAGLGYLLREVGSLGPGRRRAACGVAEWHHSLNRHRDSLHPASLSGRQTALSRQPAEDDQGCCAAPRQWVR